MSDATWTRLDAAQGSALRAHFPTAHEALLEMLRLYALRTGETPYVHRVGDDGYDIYRTERADA